MKWEYTESSDSVNLEKMIDQNDIHLEFLNDLDEIHGLYIQYLDTDIFIINKDLDWKSKRFTIAHEMGHFLLWEKEIPKNINHIFTHEEEKADIFAMNLLLPNKLFKKAYEKNKDITEVSNIFWVPEKIVIKKLESCKLK